MMTQSDYDRDAAQEFCLREHSEAHVNCSECDLRLTERHCTGCGAGVRDGELTEEPAGQCMHLHVKDGFERTAIWQEPTR